jgi:MoxR-like ATPase
LAHLSIQLIGREEELEQLESFLDAPEERALLLEGPAGIGKTSLWRAGLDAAASRGFRSLTARGSSAEMHFGYAGLSYMAFTLQR